MNEALVSRLADELFSALRSGRSVAPLTERFPHINIENAYCISDRFLARRLNDGETLIGRKIGFTSARLQQQLGVSEPSHGYLTNRMRHESGEEIPISGSLIQPRIEGEIAFILKQDLCGPHVTAEQVIEATEAVVPCFEIVDSRVRDWRIKAQDSIADNASCGLVVVGEPVAGVQGLDLIDCRVMIQKNDQPAEFGSGAQALGSPAGCVAWLANRLGQAGGRLRAGELIISGALVPAAPVSAGDSFRLAIEGLGGVDVRFM